MEIMKESREHSNHPYSREFDMLLDSYSELTRRNKKTQKEIINPYLWFPNTELMPPTINYERVDQLRLNLLEKIADGLGSIDKTERLIAIEALASLVKISE